MNDAEKEDRYIHREISRLKEVILDSRRKIQDLQELCSHPGIQIEYKSDTGNWCKYDDHYWAVWKCPNCGWQKNSSQEEAWDYIRKYNLSSVKGHPHKYCLASVDKNGVKT